MTITFATTHSGRQSGGRLRRRRSRPPASRSTTRSSPTSSRPASPSRPRRPGGGYLAADRHVRRGRPGRRASRRSCCRRIPTWTPRVVRGALVGTATRRGRLDGDGPAPVEAQGGRQPSNPGRRGRGRWSSPSRRRCRSAWRARLASSVTRVLTLANTGSCDRARLDRAQPRRRRRRRRLGRAHGRAVVDLAIAPGASVPVPLTLKAHGLPDADDRDRRLADRLGRRRRHAARALGARRAATTSRPA